MPYSRPGYMYYAVATRNVDHGDPVAVNGIVGVAVKQKALPWAQGLTGQKTVITGESFAMITKGVVQVAAVGSDAKGDLLYITSTNALTKSITGNTVFGRTVSLPGERGTPTGRIRVDLDKKL